MTIRQRQLGAVLLFLLVMLFAYISPKIVNTAKYTDSDFFSFWLASRMIPKEQDPYDSNQWTQGHELYGSDWISDSTYLYPLPLAVILAPIGLLPLFDAYSLWIFLSLIMILGSLLLLGSIRNHHLLRLNEIIPLIAGALLFRPVIITLRNGQLGGFILLLLVSSLYFLEREKYVIAGALLGATLLKPSLGFPIAGFLVLWVILSRKWQVVKGFGITLIGLFIIGWLANPSWLKDYLPIAIRKGSQTLGLAPTGWGLAGLACSDQPACTLGIGLSLTALLYITLLVFYVKRGSSIPPRIALAAAIPAALFVTPHIWAYDQIPLVVSIIVLAIELKQHGYPYVATATLTIVFSLAALILVFVALAVGRDAWSAGLSLFLLVAIIWSSGRYSTVQQVKVS